MRGILDKTFQEKCLALKEKFTDMLKGKKGVMNEVIGAFIILLVVSIIAGMTFLFLSTMKEKTAEMDLDSFSVVNETLPSFGELGDFVATIHEPAWGSFVLGIVTNGTVVIDVGNYTSTSAGFINVTVAGSTGDHNGSDWNVSYTYNSAKDSAAYQAVNDTEEAGTTIVDFLPILFLAIIFGAILTVVLRVILPFINLGQQAGF